MIITPTEQYDTTMNVLSSKGHPFLPSTGLDKRFMESSGGGFVGQERTSDTYLRKQNLCSAGLSDRALREDPLDTKVH